MNGVLVIDKPQGPTSHDVVATVRRYTGERRIGHTGTLDPLATGVLALACGRATRLVRFLTASDKDYETTIRFGLVTDSYDVTGREVRRSTRRPTREDVETALVTLRGRSLQTPPAFSAKKVNGQRSYTLARQHAAVELTPVPVVVSRAVMTAFEGDRAVIALTCSAGFYVRSFAYDLGEAVGVGACMETLRRTRSGDFSLDKALTLGDLPEQGPEGLAARLVGLDDLLPAFPAVQLTDDGYRRVATGQSIEPKHASDLSPGLTPADVGHPAEWTRVFGPDARLVALATVGPVPGTLHPSIVLI